jgi:hypothetical protein
MRAKLLILEAGLASETTAAHGRERRRFFLKTEPGDDTLGGVKIADVLAETPSVVVLLEHAKSVTELDVELVIETLDEGVDDRHHLRSLRDGRRCVTGRSGGHGFGLLVAKGGGACGAGQRL